MWRETHFLRISDALLLEIADLEKFGRLLADTFLDGLCRGMFVVKRPPQFDVGLNHRAKASPQKAGNRVSKW